MSECPGRSSGITTARSFGCRKNESAAAKRGGEGRHYFLAGNTLAWPVIGLEFCLQPEFVTGAKLLAEFDFTFDICIRHQQLRSVAQLARRVREVNFILDHFGKPDVRAQTFDPWAGDLKTLAEMPNVVCKISGLTSEADWDHWKLADLRIYVERALECFGFDRVLFSSDWPVATLATDYRRWLETVQEVFFVRE